MSFRVSDRFVTISIFGYTTRCRWVYSYQVLEELAARSCSVVQEENFRHILDPQLLLLVFNCRGKNFKFLLEISFGCSLFIYSCFVFIFSYYPPFSPVGPVFYVHTPFFESKINMNCKKALRGLPFVSNFDVTFAHKKYIRN